MEKQKKCIHDGHRLRLIDTVNNAGIENVSPVQAMEFILFYVFPRGDVNPLAHRLLDEFGSVSGVLDAGVEQLKTVEGIGDRSAKMLHMMSEIFFYYTHCKRSKRETLKNYMEICDYLEDLLRFRAEEHFWIIALDSKFKVKNAKDLGTGTIVNVGIDPKVVANFVISSRPTFVLFAHNHPGGDATPSEMDIKGNRHLEDLITRLGVKFLDHLIVGVESIYSIKHDRLIRLFEEKLPINLI